jgi:transcriptional regulator with XRE-family HTH domain
MMGKSSQKKWSPVLIRQLRGKRTQEEFARLLGAPKNTVWRWEAGLAAPAGAYAKKLSQIAAREQFLLDWQPVGSITWVGDLDAGSKQIALEFSRSLVRGSGRHVKSKPTR